MKTLIVSLMALAVFVVVGCQSPEGGGLSSDQGFHLETPFLGTDIKQGDSRTVMVTVKRDSQFKEDVRLEATASPGISVDPTNVTVNASDSPDVPFQITAPDDAAIGGYRINVKAIPETGQSTSAEIKVKVVRP